MEIEEQFRRDMRKLLEDHALSAEEFMLSSFELMRTVLQDRAWRKLPKEDLREDDVER